MAVGVGAKQRRNRRAEKQKRGESAIKKIHAAWAADPELTKKQAVGIALLGVPVWAFLLKFFLRELAEWAWEKLVDSAT